MKKISIFAAGLFILMIPVFANDIKENQLNNLSGTSNLIELVDEHHDQDLMDCTFNIKGTFDGVKVDLQITVYDIGWVECGLLKLGVKDALK